MNKKSDSIIYYGLRVAQLWSLLLAGLSTVITIFFVILVATVNNVYVIGSNIKLKYPADVDRVNTRTINVLSLMVAWWCAVALAVTLISLTQPRTRKYDKPRTVTSVVVIAFCFVSTMSIQIMVRQFIARYLVGV